MKYAEISSCAMCPYIERHLRSVTDKPVCMKILRLAGRIAEVEDKLLMPVRSDCPLPNLEDK